MTAAFSWVDLASLIVGVASLVVTIAIFRLGQRLTFRQRRERDAQLNDQAWEVLRPVRQQGLSSKVIIMNADRYDRRYDGTNDMNWHGLMFEGAEITDIDHGGVQVILHATESYYDGQGRRTLSKTSTPAENVLEIGHLPWDWIEHINPEGDEYDGSPIFFVHYRAAGRRPFDHITFHEAKPVPFGPHNRDYYRPVPDLRRRRPKFFVDWWKFMKSWRMNQQMEASARKAGLN
jgi:hypothetical protein